MSTSGVYNYRPKVEHPNAVFPQMTSDGFQKPFFFGGSQVPTDLGINKPAFSGSGLSNKKYTSNMSRLQNLGVQGRGIETTVDMGSNIYLPKHNKTLIR